MIDHGGRTQALPKRPPRGPKAAVRQALTTGNLRAKQGERNAVAKLCTAKQVFASAVGRSVCGVGHAPTPRPTGAERRSRLRMPRFSTLRFGEAPLTTAGGERAHRILADGASNVRPESASKIICLPLCKTPQRRPRRSLKGCRRAPHRQEHEPRFGVSLPLHPGTEVLSSPPNCPATRRYRRGHATKPLSSDGFHHDAGRS